MVFELVLKVGKILISREGAKDLPGEGNDKSKGLHVGKCRVCLGNRKRCGVK